MNQSTNEGRLRPSQRHPTGDQGCATTGDQARASDALHRVMRYCHSNESYQDENWAQNNADLETLRVYIDGEGV